MKKNPSFDEAFLSYSEIDMSFSEDQSLHCSLRRYFKSRDGKQHIQYHIDHSQHSLLRAGQRAIPPEVLLLMLDFGTAFFRQGMVFYAVLNKHIPSGIKPALTKKLKNLVVVMGSHGKQIVTCYYSRNPVKYLRKKKKELSKHYR